MHSRIVLNIKILNELVILTTSRAQISAIPEETTSKYVTLSMAKQLT